MLAAAALNLGDDEIQLCALMIVVLDPNDFIVLGLEPGEVVSLKALDDVGLLAFGQLFLEAEQAAAVLPCVRRVIACAL